MKTLLLAASLLATVSSAMATDVGVSISVGQPGFYGRLDVGQFAPPPVIYAQPMIIERPVRYVERAPIYLRVPPGHAKHWSKHCRAYNACGQRVYFVQDGWYNNEFAPRYREQHRDHRDHGRDERGYQDDRRDNDNDNDRGKGHGHGRGHGNGHGNGHGRGNN
ncbi:hypothetical protein [Janthinobacterium fluminis]|uniref:Uncharacterized protein n=1 Tax=Janthinobacterium fluminis TaxID=2987524 RepID=A0ABT5K0C5_9BURK|nr:hypothetical protein [Janthinobacterium fluminis]MDC8758181.1 hypothetical protein [Janthinobacterium fluminis]